MRSLLKSILLNLLLISPVFSTETVVCIHGFMGAPWNMHFLAKNIRRDGWHVVNWKYPSREAFISEHAEQLVKDLIHLSHSNPGKPIHFVTHSMGGLVLLSALNHPNCPNEGKTGKVVLIAPPIKGSSWGRWAGQFSAIKSIVKNFSGQELITETNFEHFGNFPDSLEKILVISGNFGMNPLLSEPNDGTLAISETRPSTPHEHLIVKSGHKSIIFSKQVCRSTLHFLRP